MIKRLIISLALSCFDRPRLTLCLLSVISLVSVIVGTNTLTLRLEWTALFKQDDPVVVKFQEARAKFPYPGDIVVLVDGGEPENREAFVETLAARLAAEPGTFYHELHAVSLDKLSSKALFYLPEDQLQTIDAALKSTGQAATPDSEIQRTLLRLLKQTMDSRGRETPSILQALLEEANAPVTPQQVSRLMEGRHQQPLTLAEDRISVLLVKGGTKSNKLEGSGKAVRALRFLLTQLDPESEGLRVRLAGVPVLLEDERSTCLTDGALTGLLGTALVTALLVLGFGEFRRPAQAVLSLAVGLSWTFAFAGLVVGHLNFITVTMTSMLLGLGIDFGIHILLRYEEESRSAPLPREAFQRSMETGGLDSLAGALATALAFAALSLVDFRGIADLGIISAAGLILCYLSVVTVLPALIALSPQPRTAVSARPFAAIEAVLFANTRAVIVGTVCLVAFLSAYAPEVGFAGNLLELQAPQLETVQTERQLLAETHRSSLSAAVLTPNLETARSLQTRLQGLPAVETATSLADALPAVNGQKQALIESIVSRAQELRMPAPIPLKTAKDLKMLQSRFALNSSVPQHEEITQSILEAARQMGPGPLQDSLSTFQTSIRSELQPALQFLQNQRAQPPTIDDIQPEVKVRSLSSQGDFLVTIYPKRNIWEREALLEFLSQVRSVTPDVVGHPVIQEHIVSAFQRAHRLAAWSTLIGLSVMCFALLRKWSEALIVLSTTGMSTLSLLGCMGLSHISFNAVNFVGLPICMAVGAVFGIHVMERIKETGPFLQSNSTGTAVLLSGLTTMVGFGSLTLASHQGIASLGWVISVGVGINLVLALVFLPAAASLAGIAQGDLPARSNILKLWQNKLDFLR